MLKLGAARLLDRRDLPAVRALLDDNPIAGCMVSARVESAGLESCRLGGEMWGVPERSLRQMRLDGLCYAGPNLVPLTGSAPALQAFAERALRRRRTCSSVVGPAEQVLGIWSRLAGHWGPAREVRPDQPLMALFGEPRHPPDEGVRAVLPDELDRYLPAAVAMFREEVGVDPRAADGGAGYRAKVAGLIGCGRAFARVEQGEVVFKAEIGALSTRVGQIQGVWVHPAWRGRGLGTAGTASVARMLVVDMGRTASLYVNAFNAAAIAAYRRVGFRQVGSYATVLF